MKRETHRHPKLLDLIARLNCSRPKGIGVLALLWDFTAEYAIQGDIGKHSNGVIARACDWEGSPDEFVDALIAAGWLDAEPTYRLVVHDWADHCERWVKLKAGNLNIGLIGRSIESPTGVAVRPLSPRDQSNPNQSKPNQEYSDDFEFAWKAYPRRAGENPKKSAYKAWTARLKEGVDAGDMIEGVARYAAYCQATGSVGSQFVKQAKTFFGPDNHFLEPFDLPAGGTHEGTRKLSPVEQVQQRAIERARHEAG